MFLYFCEKFCELDGEEEDLTESQQMQAKNEDMADKLLRCIQKVIVLLFLTFKKLSKTNNNHENTIENAYKTTNLYTMSVVYFFETFCVFVIL